MQEKIERLIKIIYRKYKGEQPKLQEAHPDEETLACFLENKLSEEEGEQVKTHLISCNRCAEIIATQIELPTTNIKEVPIDLLARAKDLVKQEDKISLLEIYLRLKEKFLEILSTTGDVLVGQELVPAPILRSRKIADFKDEITILKDFQDIRVEVRIENKLGQAFSLTIVVKEKSTQKIMKDLRVTLIKDDLELESYLADSGKVIFEHVLLGKYTVEISTLDSKLASVLLDIKL